MNNLEMITLAIASLGFLAFLAWRVFRCKHDRLDPPVIYPRGAKAGFQRCLGCQKMVRTIEWPYGG